MGRRSLLRGGWSFIIRNTINIPTAINSNTPKNIRSHGAERKELPGLTLKRYEGFTKRIGSNIKIVKREINAGYILLML